MTTSPRSALERLTRWRDYGLFHAKSPYKDVQALDKQNAMNDDVVALLSTVEQMREALTDFTAARQLDAKGNGVAWYLGRLHEAWVKASAALPPAPTEDKP